MKQVLGGPRTVVGIEDNKPEAIASIKAAVARLQSVSSAYAGIEVAVLKKKYPQGGEKQLIDAVAHRQVKSMGLPIDVGAVVQNVATSLAVYEAVMKNKPLVIPVPYRSAFLIHYRAERRNAGGCGEGHQRWPYDG